MPKSVPKTTDKKIRHQPLHVEIDQDNDAAKYGRISQPGKRRRSRKSEDEEREDEVCYWQPTPAPWSIHSTISQEVFDSKTSTKIIQLARDQQEELALREELEVGQQEATR
jgi:essential nuclear protein 1